MSETIKQVVQKKWTYALILSSIFAMACVLILPVPRYYKNGVPLALELRSINEEGGLSDITTSVGFNLNDAMLSDATSPELCLELLKLNRSIS